VADRLHKIIGFVVGLEVVPGTLKIPMLAVKKEYRKQGIGSALLNNFLEEAALQNIKQADLEVKKDNKQAIKFYQKHGFEIVETISKFYQNGEDAYIMRRAI
jgi:ribosomal-protein-alanine N-acetyltransferase